MRTSWNLVFALLLWITIGSMVHAADAPSTQPAVVTPPPRENFHIYLLMGQSNMVGRDTKSIPADQENNAQILSLNPDGQWVHAKDPLHHDARIPAGVGPGMSFAKEMLKANPKVTIGLVPCAVGGTGLKRWVKKADLYEAAIARAKKAAESGTLSGVLWHQGETDTSDQKNAETYEARLTQMLKDLRADLDQPNLPIVVGQLGEFLSLNPDKYPHAELVQTALKSLPDKLPKVGFAPSTGLADKGDKLHFSADAEREFGVRFAKSMQEVQK